MEMDKFTHRRPIIRYNSGRSIMSFIVGIDEAGRGPLAGPVAVGAVLIRDDFAKRLLKGIKDSKKLSETDRELWFNLALEAKKRKELDFAVALVSEKVIDKHGITYAIKIGIVRVLGRLGADASVQVFLDGGLKAPPEYPHQLTVIKGDEKIPVIALASIVAKVTRDRRMIRAGKKFPNFSFQVNKGYGTAAHRAAIKKYGLTELHRRTFLKRLT
jgi:ribonuclease HII